MKLIKKDRDNFVFQLGKREKRLLFEVLKLYPLVPGAHHRVSKNPATQPLQQNRKLLETALAERRQENRRQLLAMLNAEERFKEIDGGYRFTLGVAQMEWLLQVLNDIRVGSWIVLGEPNDNQGKSLQLTADNLRHYAAMEFCGLFQMALINAFEERT